MIPSRVATYIRDHAIFALGERVLVAVSGGPDSVALLAILRELQPTLSLHLTVAHYDHGWRPDSRDDVLAVAAFADRWGYQCIAGGPDVGVAHTENAARIARYAFLRKTADETRSQVIATGHTQDDQVETLLLHLLRGSGTHGLAAMRPRAGDLARPLLATTRKDIERYLMDHQLTARHDPTNDNPRFARNRLRQVVLPALDTFHPQARRLLARAADILAEEDQLADDLTMQALQTSPDPQRDPIAFGHQPVAIQRRLLRRLFPELDFEQIDSLRRQILGGHAIDSRRHPITTRPAKHQTLKALPCTCDPATFHARDPVGHVDADRIVPPLAITHRAPGDRVQPLGFAHEKKLQDVLVDAHIPRQLRDDLPIVRDATGIVWIPGVTVAETRRVTASSKRQLHLEIVPS
jgi:tRNA(Ile)-lysidine synthase